MSIIFNYNSYCLGNHLCQVPNEILDNLHLGYMEAEKTPPNNGTLSNYRQWFWQETKNKNVRGVLDSSYVVWKNEKLIEKSINFFNNYVNEIVKFRFSFLPAGKNVDYHATHHLPRIHIPLSDCDSTFVIKDFQGSEHSFNLKYGNAYFLNVTYPHKVLGDVNKDRKNCFFSFVSFKDKFIHKFKQMPT